MLKAKLLMTVLVAALSVAASVSASAMAAPPEWMLNKKTLDEELLSAATLRNAAPTDRAWTLSAAINGGTTVTCTGNLEFTSPEVISPNKIKMTSLVFGGCTTTPTSCTVPTTIGTVAIEGEFTLDGTQGAKSVIKPQSGSVFTSIRFSGTGCAIGGEAKALSGDFEMKAPTEQEERTDQQFEASQGATGLLRLGGVAASFAGSALLLLANRAAWSFL